MAEYAAGGGSLQKEYVYKAGALVATVEPSGGTKYAAADHLGTPRAWTNSSGGVIVGGRHDYAPYGEELLSNVGVRGGIGGYGGGVQADGQRKQFGSKERDTETGLDYFLARYYSSMHGRFISPDEFTGGPTELFAEVAAHNPTFYAEIAEPQSLNKYIYCLNNPFKFVDPDGHQTTLADYTYIARAAVTAAPGTVEAAKGVAKSGLNFFIGIGNLGKMATNEAPTPLYEPSNEIQARAMGVTDKELVVAGFLGGRGPANVMMGRRNKLLLQAPKFKR